jgi:splicing factor 3B subunit 1
VVQHISMGVPGLGCEDALRHLLNFVWPNIFEDTPHLVNAVNGAIDGCRLSLGPAVVLHYTLQASAAQLAAGRGRIGCSCSVCCL